MLTVASPGEESVDEFRVINFGAQFFLAVRISVAWIRAEVAETARVSTVTVALDLINMGNVMSLWCSMSVADGVSKVVLIDNAGCVFFLFAIRSGSGLFDALETSLAFVAIATSVWAGADAIMA